MEKALTLRRGRLQKRGLCLSQEKIKEKSTHGEGVQIQVINEDKKDVLKQNLRDMKASNSEFNIDDLSLVSSRVPADIQQGILHSRTPMKDAVRAQNSGPESNSHTETWLLLIELKDVKPEVTNQKVLKKEGGYKRQKKALDF